MFNQNIMSRSRSRSGSNRGKRVTPKNVRPFNKSWKQLQEEGHEEKFREAVNELHDEALLIKTGLEVNCRDLYRVYQKVADYLATYKIAIKQGAKLYKSMAAINSRLHDKTECEVSPPLIRVLVLDLEATVSGGKTTGRSLPSLEKREAHHSYLE